MSDFEPIDVDWTDASMEPGERQATVSKCESTKEGQPLRSKAGDRMLKLTFKLEPSGLLTDYIMIEGPGAPMGARKLVALGVVKGSKLVPDDLIGRRVVIDTVVEDFRGEPQLRAKKYIALASGSTPAHEPTGEAPW